MTDLIKTEDQKSIASCLIYLRFIDLGNQAIKNLNTKLVIDENEFIGTTNSDGEIGPFKTTELLKKIDILVQNEETHEWKKIGESFTEPGRKRIHIRSPKIKGETKLKPSEEQYIHELTCKDSLVINLEPEPPWLAIARQEERKCVGEIGKAIKNKAIKAYDKPNKSSNTEFSKKVNSKINIEFHNPDILKYHRSTPESGLNKTDEIAWCSAFVNWVMQQVGYQGTKYAGAWSWRSLWPAQNKIKSLKIEIDKEGKKIPKPCYGCIAVIVHESGQGHVGFIVGKHKNKLIMLGGNQSDMLRYMPIDSEGLTYLIPTDYTPPEGHYDLPEITGTGETGGTR